MRLNGYRASHRNKWLFIKEKVLSIQELALLEYYADTFVFDPSKEKYGLVYVNFSDIASVFRCSSQNTVRNWHKKLLLRKFIDKTSNKNYFALRCCERYIVDKKFKGEANRYGREEKNYSLEMLLQNFGVDFQLNEKKVQNIGEDTDKLASKTLTRDLGSSKGEYLGSVRGNVKEDIEVREKDSSKYIERYPKTVRIGQEERTHEEYVAIQGAAGKNALSIDDMRWIDNNVYENKKVNNEIEEKDIIEIFFDGDVQKYRNSIRTK